MLSDKVKCIFCPHDIDTDEPDWGFDEESYVLFAIGLTPTRAWHNECFEIFGGL